MLARRYWPAAAAAIVTTTIETAAVVRGHEGAAFAVVSLLLLIAAAALLTRDREQRGNAILLELGAVAAAFSDLDMAIGRWGVQLGFTARFWVLVPLPWFFLRYPDRQIRIRWHRWLLGWLAAFTLVAWTVDSLLWDPIRIGIPEPNHWVTIGNWEGFRDHLQLWSVWALTLGLLAGAAALVQRWRAAHGLDRVAVRTVAAAGIALALVVAVTQWLELVLTRYVTVNLPDLSVVREAALGLATMAVLVEALRRRSSSIAVVDELFSIGSAPERVPAVLRRAFADPALTVHLDDVPHAENGRVSLPLIGRSGRQLGSVDTDVAALHDPAWSRTVLSAAGVVVENIQLHHSVLDSLAEVRSSRARLVEAGLDERRRVERDLHDGAQQHLLAVASSLGRLELVDGDIARKQAVDDAKTQLGTALSELRRLARGIYPPVLTQAGLGAALRTLPDTTHLPVRLDLATAAEQRYRPAIESTAWFVACEAVANAVKHAEARRIDVSLHARDDTLAICVRDDGHGGARITDGGGLAGLHDRLQALGGDLDVRSEPDTGTIITATIPVSR